MRRCRQIEEPVCRTDQPFPEERAANLEHQLVVVLKAELKDALDRAHRSRPVSQLEQGLPQPGESVLMVGIKSESLLEAPPGPGEFLTCQVGVCSTDVELDCVGVKRD